MLMKSGKQVAQLMYGPNGFRVMRPGDHVICAASGETILLEELRDLGAPSMHHAVKAEVQVGLVELEQFLQQHFL